MASVSIIKPNVAPPPSTSYLPSIKVPRSCNLPLSTYIPVGDGVGSVVSVVGIVFGVVGDNVEPDIRDVVG